MLRGAVERALDRPGAVAQHRRAVGDEHQLDRADALREMTLRYRELMHANEPVHGWPLD